MGSSAFKSLARRAMVLAPESESGRIMRNIRANKEPGSLAYALDATLKQGHDLTTFGLGTAASMSSRERYARFTSNMYAVYSTMEEEMDRISLSSSKPLTPVSLFWSRLGDTLRRAPNLSADLADVGIDSQTVTASPKTLEYLDSIRMAAEEDSMHKGGRLLGHAYCRYLADLFGGQMLALPTRAALSLPDNTPRHYIFLVPANRTFPNERSGVQDLVVLEGGRRAEFIEEFYQTLNEAQELLARNKYAEREINAVVQAAYDAFEHNAEVYGEEPVVLPALQGGLTAIAGVLFYGSTLRSS